MYNRRPYKMYILQKLWTLWQWFWCKNRAFWVHQSWSLLSCQIFVWGKNVHLCWMQMLAGKIINSVEVPHFLLFWGHRQDSWKVTVRAGFLKMPLLDFYLLSKTEIDDLYFSLITSRRNIFRVSYICIFYIFYLIS